MTDPDETDVTPPNAPDAKQAAAGPTTTAVPQPGPPPRPSRASRFRRWAGTPVGVGVVVAVLMLLFAVIPVGVAGFIAGHVSAEYRHGVLVGHEAGRGHRGVVRGDMVGPGQPNQRPRWGDDQQQQWPKRPPGWLVTPSPQSSS